MMLSILLLRFLRIFALLGSNKRKTFNSLIEIPCIEDCVTKHGIALLSILLLRFEVSSGLSVASGIIYTFNSLIEIHMSRQSEFTWVLS